MKLLKRNELGMTHWLLPLVVVVVIVLIGVRVMMSTHAAAPVDSDPPSGLIIQVSTLSPSVSPSTLKAWLESIRQNNHAVGQPGYINSVVLQDIADQNGN